MKLVGKGENRETQALFSQKRLQGRKDLASSRQTPKEKNHAYFYERGNERVEEDRRRSRDGRPLYAPCSGGCWGEKAAVPRRGESPEVDEARGFGAMGAAKAPLEGENP